MTLQKQLTTAVAIALVAALLGIALLVVTSPQSTPTTTTTVIEVTDLSDDEVGIEKATTSPATAAKGTLVGTVCTYDVESLRSVELIMAADNPNNIDGQPAGVALDLALRAQLTARVYGHDERGLLIGLELSDVSSTVATADTPAVEQEPLVAALAGEVLVEVSPAGAIGNVVFPESSTEEARNHWRDLLAHCQVSLPEQSNAPSWEAVEVDTLGTFRAVYRRVEGSTSELRKEKIEYTTQHAASGRGLAAEIHVRSESEITINKLPATIVTHEIIEVGAHAGVEGMISDVSFTLRRVSQAVDGDVANGATDARSRFASGDQLRVGAPEQPVVEAEEEAVDAAQLLSHTEGTLAASGLQSPQTIAAMKRLIDALRRDDSVADDVIDRLANATDNSDLRRLLLGALGAAGTERAQQGLEEVFVSDEWPVETRRGALFAFAQVQQPRAEVDHALRALHAERGALAGNALLVLGAVGHHSQDDAERFEQTSDYLLATLRAAGTEREERIVALEAIGNLGLPATPREIANATRDADAAIRVASTHALQRIADETADQLLEQLAVEDESARVREEAVDVIQLSQRVGAIETLERIATEDPTPRVRHRALGALTQLAPVDECAATLRWIVDNDTSADVRERAQEILNGSST